MMQVGISIFKQTDNPAESEPRMSSNWTFQGGQLFEVPLHDNNQHFARFQLGSSNSSQIFWDKALLIT